jgi:2-polyprenyl-3-methyl-5-hydroxy-6-metoxy-1,4-benzoquinol methylase
VSKSDSNNQIWNGYFSSHYGSLFTEKETKRALNFQWGQLKQIAKKAKIHKDDKVLEIGCALGSFISYLQDAGVTNISATELDLEAATYTERVRDITVSTETISDYSGGGEFDKIYAFEVLEHLDNPQADLSKIHQLLKPGGKFIASTPYPFKRSITSDVTHVNVLHPLNWERLLDKAGFDVELLEPASGIPYFHRISKVFSLYVPFYVPFLPVVSTTLIVARKRN